MVERSTTPDAPGRVGDEPLPVWLDRYADWGLRGLLAGAGLCLLAFLTNPVPDPSFPWATLPAAVRAPVTQPRIEHWPVTYTVGIWLWVFCLPSAFLAGYRRYGAGGRRGSALWLAGLPTAAMLALATYCRFFWPKLHPPTWNAPSYTFVCWLYCSSYVPAWSDAAYAVAALGLGATALAYRRTDSTTDRADSGANRGADPMTDRGTDPATYALAAFGVLALPLGLPALYAAYLRH